MTKSQERILRKIKKYLNRSELEIFINFMERRYPPIHLDYEGITFKDEGGIPLPSMEKEVMNKSANTNGNLVSLNDHTTIDPNEEWVKQLDSTGNGIPFVLVKVLLYSYTHRLWELGANVSHLEEALRSITDEDPICGLFPTNYLCFKMREMELLKVVSGQTDYLGLQEYFEEDAVSEGSPNA